MGDQVQIRSFGNVLQDLDGILQGTLGEGAVLEGVNVVIVLLENLRKSSIASATTHLSIS